MRAKKTLLFCITFLYACACLGQEEEEKQRVAGKVSDKAGVPVSFANIGAYVDSDSSMVAGVQVDVEGNFIMMLLPGTYSLKFSFVSYETLVIPNVIVESDDLDLGAVVLEEESAILNEVVVTGRKDAMELSADKRVFNVGQDLRTSMGNASDVLNNIPSVSVDPDGQVSLRGSENVTIWINGKPSSLTSRDPDALRRLQGNMIERVEVITNPSSRYDAAGAAGIINIVLKKEQREGLNGTFTANAGYPTILGGSYNLNYRKGKVNLFSMYGINHNNTPGKGKSYQYYNTPDTSFIYDQRSTRLRNELSHNVMLGVDYYFNDRSNLTASATYNPSVGKNSGTTIYNDYDETGMLINNTGRYEREAEDESDIEGVLTFTQNFKKEGQVLTADLKYISSRDDEITNYDQYSTQGETLFQESLNFATERNVLIQSDYIHPFGKQGKLEAGIKVTQRTIDSEYSLNQMEDEQWNNVSQFTDNLFYDEKIQAAYLMVSNQFNKLNAQAGLRAERSDISTALEIADVQVNQNYFNLFPTANVSYKVKASNTLQASYSYRIGRPDFRDLLPSGDFRDPRSLFLGNPLLKPEYTHSVELGYLLEFEKGSILGSVYHRHRKNVVQRITEIDENSIARITPVNLASENNYGLELNASLNPVKWWRLNGSANFFRSIIEGFYKEEEYNRDTYAWMTRTSSNLTMFKAVEFQSSFNYFGPRTTTQGKDLASYSIDLGLSHDVLKGNATITAGVRDLLNTRARRRIIDSEGYYSDSRFQGRLRQFTVTFTYRLNTIKERNRDRNGGDQGEENDEN
ncbi:MAG: outer membrane beta-barrel family protein [Chryseolinea sp.]